MIEGVYNYGKVTMNNGTAFEIDNIGVVDNSTSGIISLAMDSITNDGGQSLVFAETRKRTVSLAKKTSETVSKFLDKSSKLSAQIVIQQYCNLATVVNGCWCEWGDLKEV